MALESFKRINDLDLNPEKDLIQIYNKKTDTMGVINPSQISTPLPSGVLSVDNPLSSTLQPIEDKSGTASALSISTNRVGLASDPSVTTQTSSVIQSTTTNANLVIAPNGSGALVAQIPDGTATGGNARGANAVDLQTSRALATQVSSGEFSSILGGLNNRNLAPASFIGGGNTNFINGSVGSSYQNKVIVGGSDNQISNVATRNTFIGGGYGNNINGSSEAGLIVGGYQNTLSGNQTVISGGQGNTVSSNYSVVSGGQSNTASTNSHATVCGGFTNTASGQYSTVSGGQSNVASGNFSFAHGFQAVASALGSGALNNGIAASNYSMAINAGSVAPTSGTNNGSYAFAHGASSRAYLYAMQANAGGSFSGFGQSQQSNVTARREATLTTGGTTVLSLDGTGTTNLIIPEGNNRMWNVTIKFVAVVTTITGTATGVAVGDTKSQNIEIGFKKVGGVSSLVGAGVFSTPQQDASMSSASLIPTAGGSQELALTFTAPTFSGGGSVTCRVVAKIELVEVAY